MLVLWASKIILINNKNKYYKKKFYFYNSKFWVKLENWSLFLYPIFATRNFDKKIVQNNISDYHFVEDVYEILKYMYVCTKNFVN